MGFDRVPRLSWRWIFALNVPLVLVTLGLILAAVPPARVRSKRRVGVVGATLCVLGLAGVAFGLIEQPHNGWSSPVIYVPLCLGVVSFACFIVYERRANEPMLELQLFSHRNFAVGNVETFAFHQVVLICAALLAVSGVVGAQES